MENTKILLIEDSKTQAIEIKFVLEKNGYEVECLDSAVKGIERLNTKESVLPDLILTDVNMPEINGYEFCRLAKQNNDSIFVIILTADTDEYAIEKAFDAGAVDFISKPLNKTELLGRIKIF